MLRNLGQWTDKASRSHKLLRFWWRILMIRPFPDNLGCLEDLAVFGTRHFSMGFNRECIRAYIFWRLHQHLGCTSFVETGTMHGSTAAFVRRVFKTPVFTCEIDTSNYLISRAYLAWARGITLSRSSSPDFLRNVCYPSVIGDNPMFYLDAHWYNYMPLPDELLTIADRCEKGVILIDDFFIPGEPGFHYDEYPGIRIDLDVLETALMARRSDVSVYIPAYNPDLEPTGMGIGFAIVLMGQKGKLPVGDFPFDLLRGVSA